MSDELQKPKGEKTPAKHTPAPEELFNIYEAVRMLLQRHTPHPETVNDPEGEWLGGTLEVLSYGILEGTPRSQAGTEAYLRTEQRVLELATGEGKSYVDNALRFFASVRNAADAAGCILPPPIVSKEIREQLRALIAKNVTPRTNLLE